MNVQTKEKHIHHRFQKFDFFFSAGTKSVVFVFGF